MADKYVYICPQKNFFNCEFVSSTELLANAGNSSLIEQLASEQVPVHVVATYIGMVAGLWMVGFVGRLLLKSTEI